jgi:hypothetical protein
MITMRTRAAAVALEKSLVQYWLQTGFMKRVMYSQSTEEEAAHHRYFLRHGHLKLEDLLICQQASIVVRNAIHTHGIGSRRHARSKAASMMV